METRSINCRGQLLDLGTAKVMGILNVTPDSFYDGGLYDDTSSAFARASEMISEGADIIDVGGQSSRPGARILGWEEELRRIIPVIKKIRERFESIVISADTFYPQNAIAAVEAGADMINDISGGDMDEAMIDTIAGLGCPYVVMHMQGTPGSMQDNPSYKNVVSEVFQILQDKVTKLRARGLNDIVIDPGFGFGKTLDHNYQLMAELKQFDSLGCPVLVGISRKSIINKLLNISGKDALTGTITLNTMALERGASILRVHDVQEAVETVKIVNFTHHHRTQ